MAWDNPVPARIRLVKIFRHQNLLGGWAPRYRKWLGSPLFTSHEVRPFIRGITPFRGLTNHGSPPKINIEPENDGLVQMIFLPGVYSQVPCSSSGV